MSALFIVSGIALLIFLILTVPVGIAVKWDGGFFISLKVLFLKFRLLPKKEKKLRLRDFSKKNFEKRLRKEARAAEKKAGRTQKKKKKKTAKSSADSGSEKESSNILSALIKMRDEFGKILKYFGGHIRTKRARVNITVGGNDAAAAALRYGVISQLVAYILEFLRRNTKMKAEAEEVDLRADFEIREYEAKMEFIFTSQLIFLLLALVKFGFAYFSFADRENKKTGDKK